MAYVETGTDQLAARLRFMGQHMRRTAALKAVRAGGNVIRDAEIELTPVQADRTLGSNSLETGELKANIRVRTKYDQADGAVALIGPAGKDGKIARAAHLVEYGHRTVTGGKSKMNIDGSYSGGGKVHEKDVPAYPFLRPGWEASIAEAVKVRDASLAESMREAAK